MALRELRSTPKDHPGDHRNLHRGLGWPEVRPTPPGPSETHPRRGQFGAYPSRRPWPPLHLKDPTFPLLTPSP